MYYNSVGWRAPVFEKVENPGVKEKWNEKTKDSGDAKSNHGKNIQKNLYTLMDLIASFILKPKYSYKVLRF